MKGIRLLGLLVMTSALFSCTTTQIPRASVELSEIMAEQTTQIQTSHEAFVKLYYDELREDVEVFMREKWIPDFLSRAIKNDKFQKAHKNAHSTNDSTALGKVMIGFSAEVTRQVEKQRGLLIGRINEQESIVLAHLRQTYTDLYRAQDTVKENLHAVANVTEEKTVLLHKMKLLNTHNKLLSKAMHVSSLASTALNIAESSNEGIDKFLSEIDRPIE